MWPLSKRYNKSGGILQSGMFSEESNHENKGLTHVQDNTIKITLTCTEITSKSMKRIQPLPVCAGFFICIRNSLDRPCVTMPHDHLLSNVK